MEALGEILRMWWERSDVPSLDPAAVLEDRDLPAGVRSAAWMLTRLSDRPGDPVDGDTETSEAVEHALACIEIETALPQNRRRLEASARMLRNAPDAETVRRALWLAFCPEAGDVDGDWAESVERIRDSRRLGDVEPAGEPITPGCILLTSNVLLTTPASIEGLPQDEAAASVAAQREQPSGRFDHPIPLDTPREGHEAAHGLKALDEAVAFEHERGVLTGPVPVVLSVSATHGALESVSADHVRRILGDLPLDHLDVHVFDEAAASALIDAALVPALDRLGRPATAVRRVFGVSGPYGRHYTFLKAIAALWNVFLDAGIRAVFKTDLDQVFPQERLVAESGGSAFDLMAADLWGGGAADMDGVPVSLDSIAGALVNEADIAAGLHVPDVTDPGPPSYPEDMVFYSVLPQAVSTEAEMISGGEQIPRRRIHITGGTTGITVKGLRRARPFSPSFWGRAEDQVFALSTWGEPDRPVSLHVPGLVMRHDTSTFKTGALPSGAVSKLIGDHERILMFSAYGRMLDPTLQSIKTAMWPYTGVFISAMPATVAFVRLAVTALSWAREGRVAESEMLFTDGVRRLDGSLRFTSSPGRFAEEIAADRRGWNDFYDALQALEMSIQEGDDWALGARCAAQRVFLATRLAGSSLDAEG